MCSLKPESFIMIVRITDYNSEYNTNKICLSKKTEERWILLTPHLWRISWNQILLRVVNIHFPKLPTQPELLHVIICRYGRSHCHLCISRCRGRCWRGRPSALTDKSKWTNSKRWIILWKPEQETPPSETVMDSNEISLLFMRNSQLTFVPSASAKPPPTSRTTFHGMAAWNSPQEIMASWWREIKKKKNTSAAVPPHKKHMVTNWDGCSRAGHMIRTFFNMVSLWSECWVYLPYVLEGP